MLCNTLFLSCIDWSWSSFPVGMACQASRRDFLPNLLHPKTCFNISRGFAIFRRTRLVVSTTAMSASTISEAKAQQELLQELKKRKAVQYELLGTSWDRSVTYSTANPHYIRCSLERNYLGISRNHVIQGWFVRASSCVRCSRRSTNKRNRSRNSPATRLSDPFALRRIQFSISVAMLAVLPSYTSR